MSADREAHLNALRNGNPAERYRAAHAATRDGTAPQCLLELAAERDQLKAENEDLGYRLEAARNLADKTVAYLDKVEVERDSLRAALQAVAVSKFATEPHRIAREALAGEAST